MIRACRRALALLAALLLMAACGDEAPPATVPPTAAPTTTSSTVPPSSLPRSTTTTTTNPAEAGFVEAIERQLTPQLRADGVSPDQIRCAARAELASVGTDVLVTAGITPDDVGERFDIAERLSGLRTPDRAQRAALLLADCGDASQAIAARFALALNTGTGNADTLAACARTNLTPTQANALNAANLFAVAPGADREYDLLRYRISVEAGLVLQGLCGFDPLPVPVPTVPA